MTDKILITVDEDLADLIPGYIEKRLQDAKDITTALEQFDYTTIRSLAHKMKGSGGGYGMDFVSEFGLAVQLLAEKEQGPEIQNWVTRLIDYLSRLDITFVQEES